MLECEAINTPSLNILIDLHYTVMQGNQGMFHGFFKGIIDISHSHFTIVLYGPKLGHH